MQSTEYHIHVQPLRSSTSTDLAGAYRVFVPTQGTPDEMASIAIESFHRAIPLSYPENYEITVVDAQSGQEIVPSYSEVEKVFECKRL
ncbi:hypothetical protein [Pseudomonas putida]|uniref:Uncharacterized protein n=1 Tax=Pseudomonas putida TaxID=303 RepID=A0A8I1JJT8_PSEPU|nr:hypothetical protein [Pseudomonas putida]MBI6882745.1 hypothetical protein [Pseudomonas putida]